MLNFKIAFRFLIKKPFQTLITLLVITIGTAIFYFILNAGASIKNLVLTTTAEANSHIYITGDFDFNSYEDETIKSFRDTLFALDNRITDISYSYSIIGATKVKDSKSPYSLTLKGIDFEKGKNIQQIGSRINAHSYNSVPKNGDFDDYFGEIVIGNTLSRKLGYSSNKDAINKIVDVSVNSNIYKFKIVAVHSTDQIDLSSRIVVTTIETIQKITSLNTANAIEIKVMNPLTSEEVLNNINNTITDTYPNSSSIQWQEGNRYAVNALYIEDVSIYIIQVFTAIAISFGVTGLLLFTIREKVNQIGILKALGLSNGDTRKIFSYQVVLLSFLGIIGGLFLGDFLAILFSSVFKRPGSGVPLVALYRGVTNFYAVLTAIIMFFSCLIATLPAIRYAEKLKIIEVIKDE